MDIIVLILIYVEAKFCQKNLTLTDQKQKRQSLLEFHYHLFMGKKENSSLSLVFGDKIWIYLRILAASRLQQRMLGVQV